MSEALRPARAVAPGRIVKQELEARGWSQKDLAAVLGRPEQAVSEIVNGVKQITPETALELAQAFGTSPELWMNLEANYREELQDWRAAHPGAAWDAWREKRSSGRPYAVVREELAAEGLLDPSPLLHRDRVTPVI